MLLLRSSTLICLMIWRFVSRSCLAFSIIPRLIQPRRCYCIRLEMMFNFSPRSSLLANREGPFSGCYWVTSLEWPQMEWHSIGPEQLMKLIIDCHQLIFRSSIFIDCSGPAFKKNYTNKQKKVKWTAAPSNKILAGIIENYPYGNVSLSNNNECLQQQQEQQLYFSTLHWFTWYKNRYKYGESTGCP